MGEGGGPPFLELSHGGRKAPASLQHPASLTVNGTSFGDLMRRLSVLRPTPTPRLEGCPRAREGSPDRAHICKEVRAQLFPEWNLGLLFREELPRGKSGVRVSLRLGIRI